MDSGASVSDPIHNYLSEIGRKGGSAGRGSAKARTTEQARAAVLARWARTKRKKRRKPKRHNTVKCGHARNITSAKLNDATDYTKDRNDASV